MKVEVYRVGGNTARGSGRARNSLENNEDFTFCPDVRGSCYCIRTPVKVTNWHGSVTLAFVLYSVLYCAHCSRRHT